MASFICRVEIHSGTSRDYDALHTGLNRLGWLRTIRGDSGKNYQLPTGTYVLPSSTLSCFRYSTRSG